MATKIPELQILDQWFALLDGAAGRGDEVLSRTKELLNERNYPGVSWGEEVVKSGGWIGGKKRVLLLVRNASMKDYVMYIGARDYGSDCSVSWYLTAEPSFFKKALATKLTGSVDGLSIGLNLFDNEELRSYLTGAHHCLLEAVQVTMDSLGLDFSKLNKTSKGFLEVW